jgi:glutaredoxin
MAKVRMFTLSTCPWCMKTKAFFRQHNIEFDFTDYDLVSAAEQKKVMKELLSLGCTGSFPVVIINGEVIVGYNPNRYKEILKLK